MRFSLLVSVAAAALFGQAAVAQECLSDLVTVVGWSAKGYGLQSKTTLETAVTLGLRNHGEQDIVMIQGSAEFVDALGNVIAPFPMPLDPDTIIPAHTPGNTMLLGHPGHSRLIDLDKSLVEPSICVTGVVLADGSVIKTGS